MEDRKLLVESRPNINRMIGALKSNSKPYCCWREEQTGISYFLKRCDSVSCVYEVMILAPNAIRFKVLPEHDLIQWGKSHGL